MVSLPRLGGFFEVLKCRTDTFREVFFLSCLVGKQCNDACTAHNTSTAQSASVLLAGGSRAWVYGRLLAGITG